MIEFTEWAKEILRKSQSAASRFNPAARIRLVKKPDGVEAVLTDELDPADSTADAGGTTIYIETGLEGLVDIEEPHDRLVLRPAGSTPNIRGEH
jgi:hypothetical protein